ncbi:Co2+/Mg2+ efflux protein ApaG [Komagataeibacter nataicola]|uniref:Co2+/Mg2+ efflux protein ApaG n=1 Tax=Komagataeibacter nataicola TaxID=265960 RepID=UPI0023DD6645|nr:Co2+/Mg2+ efflux protein ApaG [Komagataeibacter nataicola]WEQ57428.1 Co2+/Mg2+ efflux protein ApaG [Komagataeibacter nataicola]
MENTPCFEATTDRVRVVVQTFWLDDQSEPDEHRYVWAYRVRIENHGDTAVQLLRRSWRIVDGQGRIERVEGEGVVGEQPLIDAAASFEYMSGAALETPTGFMGGQYYMVRPGSREHFDISIPVFSLDSPHHPTILH